MSLCSFVNKLHNITKDCNKYCENKSYCNTLPTIDETLEICCCNTEQKTKGIIFLCSLQSKNISIVTTESGVILLPIIGM